MSNSQSTSHFHTINVPVMQLTPRWRYLLTTETFPTPCSQMTAIEDCLNGFFGYHVYKCSYNWLPHVDFYVDFNQL